MGSRQPLGASPAGVDWRSRGRSRSANRPAELYVVRDGERIGHLVDHHLPQSFANDLFHSVMSHIFLSL